MKELRLQRLQLRFFKGVESFDFSPDGHNATVYGDNEAGKTTLADAFAWLFFDKDSHGRGDFSVKTIEPNGEARHMLDHEVAGTIAIDERRTELRKIYRELWRKTRGEADRTFHGHSTDYYFDDVPMPKQDYTAEVAEIANEETVKLLTDPTYFPDRLHWEKRREILLEVAGDISDDDVIEAFDELSDLPIILGDRTMDAYKKIAAERRKKINVRLDDIPKLVAEVGRSLEDDRDSLDDEANLRARLVELRVERNDFSEKRAGVAAGGPVAEKRTRLVEIDGELKAIENRLTIDHDVLMQQLANERSGVKRDLDDASRDLDRASENLISVRADIADIDNRAREAQDEWSGVDSLSFEFDGSDFCERCGQPLPLDKIESARDEATAAFNTLKSERLEAIDATRKALEARRSASAVGRGKADEALAEAEAHRQTLNEMRSELDDRIGKLIRPDPELDDDYRASLREHADVGAAIVRLAGDSTEALIEIDNDTASVDSRIAAIEQALSRIDRLQRSERRVKELTDEQRRLSNDYEELDRHLWLCDRFTKHKVSMLDSRINSLFEVARFKLFHEHVQGGYKDVCEVLHNGVPYRDANDGAKIQLGLDVIRTLQDHYGLRLPVWIDHAESVTTLPAMECQVIRLHVSKPDKTLRIEIES